MRICRVGLVLSLAILTEFACTNTMPEQEQGMAFAQATQKSPVGCGSSETDRKATSADIGPEGGTIWMGGDNPGVGNKYAAVHFQHGSYDSLTTVTVAPHDTLHGVTISPGPKNAVLVQLKIRACNDKNSSSSAYGLVATKGELPTWVIDGPNGTRWATGVADSADITPPLKSAFVNTSGFVILSN